MTDTPVPTSLLPALVDHDDMGGWDADRLREWLDESVALSGRVESWFVQARLEVGRALWHYRRVLDNETLYTAEVARLAKLYGRAASTLGAWRRDAELADGLAAPSKRSVGQRARQVGAKSRQRPVDTTGWEVGSGSDDTLPAEITKPPTVDDESSSALEAGTSPRADGSAAPRGAQPPTPNPIDTAFPGARTVRQDNIAKALAYLAGATVAEVLASTGADAIVAADEVVHGARVVLAPRRGDDGPHVDPKDCRHPPGSRVGEVCGACWSKMSKR